VAEDRHQVHVQKQNGTRSAGGQSQDPSDASFLPSFRVYHGHLMGTSWLMSVCLTFRDSGFRRSRLNSDILERAPRAHFLRGNPSQKSLFMVIMTGVGTTPWGSY
jgi:hypothetical protein